MVLKAFFDGKPYGTKAALAKKLGISKTWMSLLISGREKCSPELAIKFEIETDKAVTREALRPDIFGKGTA